MMLTFVLPPPAMLPLPLACITFPWEVPEGTVIVEFGYGRWRVVSRDRGVTTFGTREAALTFARKIAALYIPGWTIVERDEPSSEAVAS